MRTYIYRLQDRYQGSLPGAAIRHVSVITYNHNPIELLVQMHTQDEMIDSHDNVKFVGLFFAV